MVNENVIADHKNSYSRLGSPCVGPPMPRVEDQQVHASPPIAILYGVKLQDSSHPLMYKIYKVWRPI